ncbi:MAG: hypothetical protein GC193_14800 [Cryomorphaceae bacterium]|nr:hypothetical protein [Cryomorphaceae bacterium]
MKNLIYLFIAVALTSCLKPEPEVLVTLSPNFTVDGTLAATPFSMSAGVNGMYLFTDYIDNGYGQVEYVANYSNFENQDGEALSFHLMVRGNTNNTAGDLEDHLSVGNVNINPELSPAGNFIFEVVSSESPWLWSDGNIATSDAVFSIENILGLVPLVSCSSTSPSCFTSTSLQMFPNTNCNNLFLVGAINLEHGENNTLIFTPPPTLSNADTRIWSIDGNDFFTFGNAPLIIPNFGSDALSVLLTTTDMNGNEAVVIIQSFSGISLNCPFPQITAGFNQIAEPLMHVEYRDPEGAVYSSLSDCDNFLLQPGDAYFTIHDVQPYGENEHGDPTFEVIFSTKIQLFNVSSPIPGNNPIWLEIDRGNMAFSFPQ